MMRRIREWFLRAKQEQDLADELYSHLEIEKALQRDQGKSAEEAEQYAYQVFGNLTAATETVRDTWRWIWFEQLSQDFRFGIRMLRKTPVWTVIVCATLALGIGVSTAVFSVVYGVLLRPLPYPGSERIV